MASSNAVFANLRTEEGRRGRQHIRRVKPPTFQKQTEQKGEVLPIKLWKVLCLQASAIRWVEDFVIENGEVEGQSKADGVGGRQVNHGNVTGSLVCHQAVLSRFLPVIADCKLSQVPVVISLPATKHQTSQYYQTCNKNQIFFSKHCSTLLNRRVTRRLLQFINNWYLKGAITDTYETESQILLLKVDLPLVLDRRAKNWGSNTEHLQSLQQRAK